MCLSVRVFVCVYVCLFVRLFVYFPLCNCLFVC